MTHGNYNKDNRVFVALGSNIQPEENLARAVALLAERCRLLAVSRVYQTAPVGFAEQADFLNAAALIETPLDAATLKQSVLAEIESQLKRKRTAIKSGPRTIDLDIALFNDAIFEYDGRQIPDPGILEYGYVALPLADLAPDMPHPVTGETLRAIAARFEGQAGIRLREDVRLGA